MAWSVGRLVGRSVVQKGSCSRRSVVQKCSCGCRSVVQKCSCSRLRVPKKKPKMGPYEVMRPFPKWVRPPPAMAVEEVSSGEGDVEMEVPSGSSAARPPEVPKAPQLLSGTGTEGITDAEMAELRIIMEEVWSPPFEAPSAVWSCHGQPNGILRLLPPVREVAFSGAPAERQPYEANGTMDASRQTCFGDPSRSFHGSREDRNVNTSTPSSVVEQHGSLCKGARAPDGVLQGPRGGLDRGSGQCCQACSTHLDRGVAGEEAQGCRSASTQAGGEEEGEEEEAQGDRATSTQVGGEEGEAKEDQAVAGHTVLLFALRPRWRGWEVLRRKYPQRPSTPPTPPSSGPMSDVAMGSTDLPLPPPAVGPTALPVPPPPYLEAPPTSAGPPPTTALDLERSTLRLRASLTIHGSGRAWLHEPSRQSGIVGQARRVKARTLSLPAPPRRLAQAQRRAFARRHVLLAQFFALLRSRTTLPQTCPTFSQFSELSFRPRALVL